MRRFEYLETATAIPDADAGDDTLAALFYTGGTTGKSKGVMLSHRNLVSNSMNVTIGGHDDEFTTYLHAAPMFHLADSGSTFAVTANGGRHVFIPRFDPDDCLQAMQQERVTRGMFVPTMINILASHPKVPDFDLSSLRYIFYGGSSISEGVLRKALDAFPNCQLANAYGMTEASPGLTILPFRYTTLDGPYAGRLQSCGRAVYSAELKIVDANRNEVPRGTVGELAARGPMIMLGYWNKPDETAAVLEDGWYYSGDAAYMDDEGFLFIVDRLKDMIISGGENIYTAEVESAISLLPGVAEVAVIGVPDAKWGETVHAVIVPRAGADLTADAVIEHCRTQIAGYKCPRSIEFRDTPLPVSGAGKVLKRELRDASNAL
jgi:long-chain acyl-CoA synthetase